MAVGDISWAVYFRDLRAKSKYAENMTCAARTANMPPSRLHRIEGAEGVGPTLPEVRKLLALYGESL